MSLSLGITLTRMLPGRTPSSVIKPRSYGLLAEALNDADADVPLGSPQRRSPSDSGRQLAQSSRHGIAASMGDTRPVPAALTPVGFVTRVRHDWQGDVSSSVCLEWKCPLNPHLSHAHNPSSTMHIVNAISLFVSRKHERPWEVVDSKNVEPVSISSHEDGAYACFPRGVAVYLDIVYIHETDVVRTYVFDVKQAKDFQNVLLFAQRQLQEEVRTKGYNALWSEGWQVTLLRKGKKHRVEVRYTARPACLAGKPLRAYEPPFMGVLDEMRETTSRAL
ncbi:hypothetical protein EVG20_g373 [Dentipellis fragilis]|uniref:Uncharacterized protein n=1 Tax=Dentipellis fragilis TaxID=205917 RepID=A0A4Y9ZGQ4_9AGAM|nr:hypothetical protein EVG20_g373 [Dentipellis fragilis]